MPVFIRPAPPCVPRPPGDFARPSRLRAGAPVPNPDRTAGRNFAASLLELGLRHNLGDLVRKAENGGQDETAALPEPFRLYERVQDGFRSPRDAPPVIRWKA